MEANEDDDMEVDDDQELVIIPVRDKGKDARWGQNIAIQLFVAQNVVFLKSVESVYFFDIWIDKFASHFYEAWSNVESWE